VEIEFAQEERTNEKDIRTAERSHSPGKELEQIVSSRKEKQQE